MSFCISRKDILSEFRPMEFLAFEFIGNPLREWGIALAWVVGGVLAGRLIYRWFSRRLKALAAKTEGETDDLIVDQIEEPIALSVVILGFWFGYDHLRFGDSADAFMEHVFSIAVALDVTWLAARLIDALVTSTPHLQTSRLALSGLPQTNPPRSPVTTLKSPTECRCRHRAVRSLCPGRISDSKISQVRWS